MKEQTIKTGDLVRKKTGYEYIGYVVADFVKTTGERRLVVECKNTGMLHVFNESNLEPAKKHDDEEFFCVEFEGTYYLVPDSVYDDIFNHYYSSKVSPEEFDTKYGQYFIEEVAMKNKIYLKPKK